MSDGNVRIIAFYEFKDMSSLGDLAEVRDAIKDLFRKVGVRGTIILASEGYNGMVCGSDDEIEAFILRPTKFCTPILSLNPRITTSHRSDVSTLRSSQRSSRSKRMSISTWARALM